MAKREVVLDRVFRIELPQRSGDLFSRRPRRGPTICQPEVTTDAMNVRVDRNHELRGRDRPEPEVDAVGRTNHPSRVEDESLARASSARIADQVTQAATRRVAAQRIGEASQAFPEIPVTCLMELEERIAEGPVLTKQLSGPPQY